MNTSLVLQKHLSPLFCAPFEVAEVVLETSAHLKDFDTSPTFDGQWIIEREEDGGCFRVFISNKQ